MNSWGINFKINFYINVLLQLRRDKIRFVSISSKRTYTQKIFFVSNSQFLVNIGKQLIRF